MLKTRLESSLQPKFTLPCLVQQLKSRKWILLRSNYAHPILNSHGPMYIGFMFNIFLFGMVTAQIYMYMTTFKK